MAKISENKVILSGTIASIESRTGIDKNGNTYLAGKLTVEAGPDNLIPVDFYSKEKKNDGNDNGIYKSLQTVVNDYKTIEEHGRDEADGIEVNLAEISENFFYSGERFIRDFKIKAPFYNRKAAPENKAEFTIEAEIMQVVDEVVNDVPTGAVIIRGLVVTYGDRANVLDFKLEDEKGVAYAKASFVPGQQVKLHGEIIVREEIIEKETSVAFGDPIVEEKRRTERVLLVTSASAPMASSMTEEERTTMLATRESAVKEAKVKAEKKAKGSTPKKASSQDFSL